MNKWGMLLFLSFGLAFAACAGKDQAGEADAQSDTVDAMEVVGADGDTRTGDILTPDACVPCCEENESYSWTRECEDDEVCIDAKCGATVGFVGVCEAYIELCALNADAFLPACHALCIDGSEGQPEGQEFCTFIFCGVEVGLCDNEEYGDQSIMACMEGYGWL